MKQETHYKGRKEMKSTTKMYAIKLPDGDIYLKKVQGIELDYLINDVNGQYGKLNLAAYVIFPKDYSGKRCRIKIEIIENAI